MGGWHYLVSPSLKARSDAEVPFVYLARAQRSGKYHGDCYLPFPD